VRLTHRTGRLVAAAVACVALGVPAVALASSTARSVAATPQCTAADTLVWLALAPNGAAGTIYYPVEFTNIGSTKCTLSGFPGVAAIGKSGKKLGPAATRVKVTAHTITLKPHQTANALLGISDVKTSTCHATAFGLQVYPPNQKSKQIVSSFTFAACAHGSYLSVYPVKAGVGVP
jgi:Protein of unknown function (DUF4232)